LSKRIRITTTTQSTTYNTHDNRFAQSFNTNGLTSRRSLYASSLLKTKTETSCLKISQTSRTESLISNGLTHYQQNRWQKI